MNTIRFYWWFLYYLTLVTLVCGAKAMTVTLTTDEGFQGKLFAYKNPRGCQARGTGRTETSLTFLYEEEEEDQLIQQRCGVEREADGVFSNTVVIQNHPIIQQKGDRYYRHLRSSMVENILTR